MLPPSAWLIQAQAGMGTGLGPLHHPRLAQHPPQLRMLRPLPCLQAHPQGPLLERPLELERGP